jgi:transposase InsO family protein
MQYLSIHYTERFAEGGFEASVGSRGDTCDNALVKSVIGLFKTEMIRNAGHWEGLDHMALAMLELAWWYNNHPITEVLGCLPPAEYEKRFAFHLLAHRGKVWVKSAVLRQVEELFS